MSANRMARACVNLATRRADHDHLIFACQSSEALTRFHHGRVVLSLLDQQGLARELEDANKLVNSSKKVAEELFCGDESIEYVTALEASSSPPPFEDIDDELIVESAAKGGKQLLRSLPSPIRKRANCLGKRRAELEELSD